MSGSNPMKNKNTSAFFAQAALAFGISTVGLMVGILYLPIDAWARAFLAMTGLFVVTSAFTLAKVIRDAQEGSTVMSRLDEARLERLLAEHDQGRPQLVTAARRVLDGEALGHQGEQAVTELVGRLGRPRMPGRCRLAQDLRGVEDGGQRGRGLARAAAQPVPRPSHRSDSTRKP